MPGAARQTCGTAWTACIAVAASPFEGTCSIPKDIALTTSRFVLEMDGLSPEEAAWVTLNGKDAGGFVGKPFRLELGDRLKHGQNQIRIEPFAPRAVRLLVLKAPVGSKVDSGN